MRRNTFYSVIKMAVAGALVGALAACGGGSGSSNESAASAGTSVGTISGFGSVYVNGTRFRINNALYTGNDGIERESQLDKGMILKITGTWGADGQGEARNIYYDDTLRGPVQLMSWDTVAKKGTITIAGQTVKIDARTVFKGATVNQLHDAVTNDTADYRIRISGWRMADGTFQATFVGAKKKGSGWTGEWTTVEVEGAVSELDTQAQTFKINDLIVDYQSAEFDDGVREDLENGAIVEVEGKLVDGKLIAGEIEFENDWFDDHDDVEMSGTITADYDSATRKFQLNGIAILVAENAELDDGLTLGRLTEGTEVKVEGEYRNGIIVADELKMRDGDAGLSGFIESKEQGGDVLIVSGVRVILTSSTLIEDEDAHDGSDSVTRRTQDLENLQVGEYIEVEGRETSENGGGLTAFYIERDDDDDLELEGRISQITDTAVTVLGLELMLTPATKGPLSDLRQGDKVEIEFKKAGGEYHIKEIEKDG